MDILSKFILTTSPDLLWLNIQGGLRVAGDIDFLKEPWHMHLRFALVWKGNGVDFWARMVGLEQLLRKEVEKDNTALS